MAKFRLMLQVSLERKCIDQSDNKSREEASSLLQCADCILNVILELLIAFIQDALQWAAEQQQVQLAPKPHSQQHQVGLNVR
jgi:hypothetical protein